ncbi:hypothetical protein [Bradyrhizobium sp. 200]|uniref:glutamine amidotransferase-related protein n=1 Tax=Bradyrhizobium sp. 200 TaxID=2782665 RepID=UPI00320A1C4B
MCVGRYHSLIVELDESCAPRLPVTAHSEEGEIMGLAHRCHRTYGVQLHPTHTQNGYLANKDTCCFSLRFAEAS